MEAWLEVAKMEDCCTPNENKKDGIKMNRRTILWIVIAILAILVIYVFFFTGSSGNVASATQTSGQVANTYGGMVGGC